MPKLKEQIPIQPEAEVASMHADGVVRTAESPEEAFKQCPFLGSLPPELAIKLANLAAMGQEKLEADKMADKILENSESTTRKEEPEKKVIYEEKPEQPLKVEEVIAAQEETKVLPTTSTPVEVHIEREHLEKGRQLAQSQEQPEITVMEESARKVIAEVANSAVETEKLVEAEAENLAPLPLAAQIVTNQEKLTRPDTLPTESKDTPEEAFEEVAEPIEPIIQEVEAENPTEEQAYTEEAKLPVVESLPVMQETFELQEEQTVFLRPAEAPQEAFLPEPVLTLQEEIPEVAIGLEVSEPTLEEIKDVADSHRPEETISKVAVLLNEVKEPEAMPIKNALTELAEEITEDVVAEFISSDESGQITLTPKAEKKLEALLKELGYTDPEDALSQLKETGDLVSFIQSVHYLNRLYNKGDEQEFMPYLSGLQSADPDEDHPFMAKLGKIIVGLVKSLQPAEAA